MADESRRRGSFYRLMVERIERAYPTKSAAWHRQQAREVLAAVNQVGSPAALPMTSPEDVESLREDFGELADDQWQSASTAGEGSVEVASSHGIVGIRNSAHPETILLLTKFEFRSLVDDIVNRRFNFALPSDDPRSGRSRWFLEQLIKLPDEDKNRLALAVADAPGS